LQNVAFAELYGIEKGQKVSSLDDLGTAWQDKVMRQRLDDVLARGRELWDYELQQETVRRGQIMRLYVPFAEEWKYALRYLKRRLAASPSMALMVMKNLSGR